MQVYESTSDCPEGEVEKFYNDKTDNHNLNLVMGDFNTKLGKEGMEI